MTLSSAVIALTSNTVDFQVTLALFFAPIGIMGVTYALIVWRLWVSAVPDIGGTSRVHSQHNAKKKVSGVATKNAKKMSVSRLETPRNR